MWTVENVSNISKDINYDQSRSSREHKRMRGRENAASRTTSHNDRRKCCRMDGLKSSEAEIAQYGRKTSDNLEGKHMRSGKNASCPSMQSSICVKHTCEYQAQAQKRGRTAPCGTQAVHHGATHSPYHHPSCRAVFTSK